MKKRGKMAQNKCDNNAQRANYYNRSAFDSVTRLCLEHTGDGEGPGKR